MWRDILVVAARDGPKDASAQNFTVL